MSIFFITGLFKSDKSIRRKTDAVLSSDSKGVNKPKAKIPETKPLKTFPKIMLRLKVCGLLKIIFIQSKKIALNRPNKTEAKIISIRFSILRTMRIAVIEEATKKNAGMGSKFVIKSTEKASKKTKKIAFCCPNSTVKSITDNEAGMRMGSAKEVSKKVIFDAITVMS